MRKLNVLLGITDHLAASFKAQIKDYTKYFSTKQAAFRGEKKTYIAAEGTADEPGKRGIVKIQTTVLEKLDWFANNSSEYIDALFAVEKTNASGRAVTTLKIGDNVLTLSTLELLRLKNILEELRPVYEEIPVYSDAEEWDTATEEMYKNREGVLQSPKLESKNKTTEKVQYILEDPNVVHLKDGGKYVPQMSSKDTVKELGDQTFQKFTGEWSHRQRAELLQRRTALYNAVVEAIKVANEVESLPSEVTSTVLFDYLHG